MKKRPTISILSLSFVLLFLIAVLQPGSNSSRAQSRTTAKAPQEIKVGITEYQNVEESYERYEELFRELEAAADPKEPVTFKFAIGNYAEVMDWYNKAQIDVGIFSAMPVANFLRDAGPSDVARLDQAYIGDVSVSRMLDQSMPLVTGTEEELAQKDPFIYRSVCIAFHSDSESEMRADGRPRTIQDIKNLWFSDERKRQVKFIFVRPFSLSGYIVPRYVLSRYYGINPGPKDIEFSYEHQKSITLLKDAQQKDPTKYYVAFVLDETRYPEASKPGKFEKVNIDELKNFEIPRERVFVNYQLEKEKLPDTEGGGNKFENYKNIMRNLFERWKSHPPNTENAKIRVALRPRQPNWIASQPNWIESYRNSKEAIANIALPRQLPYKSTIDQLLEDYAKYVDLASDPNAANAPNQTTTAPTPRLALVLSGGGAKCAYQAGAIVEIEAKLKALNHKRQEKNKKAKAVDIDLVVGTSGGAINALLVATGMTRSDNPEKDLAKLWGSMRQQEFFKPSRRFNFIFGLCFGLLQALIITVAVLIFGRQTMNWSGTVIVVLAIGIAEVFAVRWFGVWWKNIANMLIAETFFLSCIVAIVLVVGAAISRMTIGHQTMSLRRTLIVILTIGIAEIFAAWWFGISWTNIGKMMVVEAVVLSCIVFILWIVGIAVSKITVRRAGKELVNDSRDSAIDESAPEQISPEEQHWRWLTVVLMLGFSILEVFIATSSRLDKAVTEFSNNHWILHGWMLATRICILSFPYPLIIGLLMALVGTILWRSFSWNRRREPLLWAMTICLIVITVGLLFDTLFKGSAPSKAEGIEEAFGKLPELIEKVNPRFKPKEDANQTALQRISLGIMDGNTKMLQRDLIITTSRLPISTEDTESRECSQRLRSREWKDYQVGLVNGLPDDLYFYFRANNKDESKGGWKPVDRRFVPFERNPDKLLDVVIGSSTIYPIFPSRVLCDVTLGNEEKASGTIDVLKIIDGGFIHNIPIQAASLWNASHIILIDASPLPQQTAPKDLWDNMMMAFGYLFAQAQSTDKLARGSAETYELRPTSECEKEDVLPFCVGEKAEPHMDTFDFSPTLAQEAFDAGRDDVSIRRLQELQQAGKIRNAPTTVRPLFVRVAGPPLFRTLTDVRGR